MEHMFKKILSLSLLVSAGCAFAANCNTDCNDVSNTALTCFTPRSQSFNNVIKNAGMDPDNQYLFDTDTFNGSLKLTFEYDQTFSSRKLARSLFGPAAVNAITGPTTGTTTGTTLNCNNDCGDDSIILNI